MLRRTLDEWMNGASIRPNIIGEFEDSALLMAFGQQGAGLFPAPTPIAAEVARQHRVVPVGVIPGVRELLYAVSVERQISHPAVAAVCAAARDLIDPGRASKGRSAR